MAHFSSDSQRYVLDSPTLAPNSAAFLWNRRMMVQVTCRGYAVAQFMQPEPAKYAHVPTLAGVSFMQPEQPYFAHHPGRFFYVRDEDSGELFSAPYEPTRAPLDRFEFSPGLADIRFLAQKAGIELRLTLTLTESDAVEIWQLRASNLEARTRRISIFPYFPVGYSSWMNLGGHYDPGLRAAIATSVSPYQKTEDYFKRKDFKDLTYLMADREPTSFELRQSAFEGEGGLHRPSALEAPKLAGGDALYELPACCMQFSLELAPRAAEAIHLLFGPARDRAEIAALGERLLSPQGLSDGSTRYERYIQSGRGVLAVRTPDPTFDAFVNHWLPRQVFYHGDTNRLTTDPQTRNYLQDAMGMVFVRPDATREALLRALSQQKSDGEMPDGILLYPGAELKYINRIPHTDHSVWLIVCLHAYLSETGDTQLLEERLGFSDSHARESVLEHLFRSLEYLIQARDSRGLSYIAQGDWCDPMNMVGYRGRGVSGWLTEALSYALQLFASMLAQGPEQAPAERERHKRFLGVAKQLNTALNEHLWDGKWYGRGITDENVAFGVSRDPEGSIFLNAQSWAFLCGAPDAQQRKLMLEAIDELLMTPYGAQLFAPPYTAMREDVGRVTQKFPGSAENGSVYNHAAAFYAASLFQIGEGDRAFQVLRRMLPGPDLGDLRQRGQLPVYIPNYYRGAYNQFPRTAGRSSQLFNTGTAAWFYRLVVEQLFGLRGDADDLVIDPKLPSDWAHAQVTRRFRGATVELKLLREPGCRALEVQVDGRDAPEARIRGIEAGKRYVVSARLPG